MARMWKLIFCPNMWWEKEAKRNETKTRERERECTVLKSDSPALQTGNNKFRRLFCSISTGQFDEIRQWRCGSSWSAVHRSHRVYSRYFERPKAAHHALPTGYFHRQKVSVLIAQLHEVWTNRESEIHCSAGVWTNRERIFFKLSLAKVETAQQQLQGN